MTTLATVGSGEVRPLDPAGKVVTISLVVLGWLPWPPASTRWRGRWSAARCKPRAAADAGASAWTASRPLRRRRLRPRRAGGGRVAGGARCPHLPADPTQEAARQQAGIQRAGGLWCVMDADAANVFVTLTARARNPALTIVARAAHPASVDRLLRAGGDHVVSPHDVSGRRVGWSLCTRPSWTSWTWPGWPWPAAGGDRGPRRVAACGYGRGRAPGWRPGRPGPCPHAVG